MDAIRATWKDGQVVLDGPVDWPDGSRLVIEPDPSPGRPASQREDEGPMTPEETARTLAAMDKVEPFDLTAAEAADLAAWEQKGNEYTIANMDKGIEDVFR
jgi:hypothetical protein